MRPVRLTGARRKRAPAVTPNSDTGLDFQSGGACTGLEPRADARQHDAAVNESYVYRGNPTYLGLMAEANVCVKYDTTGNVVSRKNTAGQKVETAWTNATNYQRPAAVTPNGDAGLAQTMQYNTFLGLTHLDSPNGLSQNFGWDSAARPASVQSAHGATTAMTYSGNGRVTTATTNGKFVRTTTDGLGRTVKVERGHGTTVVSVVETEYGPCACSPMGKVKRVSRPYAPGATPVWTSYTYDGIGRVTQVQGPAGQVTNYEYVANTVKSTDAAGKWKTLTLDAFGQVVKVTEPNPAGGTWETTYVYNGMGQMTEARLVRGTATQVRTWVYDDQQRLVSETHPESGTRTYGYSDGKSLVRWRKDAKNQRVEYNYL